MSLLVCMTGTAADRAAAKLQEENAALLAGHFPERFLEQVRAMKEPAGTEGFETAEPETEAEDAALPAKQKTAAPAVPIGEGGLWAALWKLGEAAGTGLTVEASAIPIRQEVVEICEFLGQDPYSLPSSGAVFLREPQAVLEAREAENGQPGFTVIGRTTKAAARVVRVGDRVRYLNRSPQ